MNPYYVFHFAFWAVCTTGITAAAILAALVLWFRPRGRRPLPAELPAITVLKPFDGIDRDLEGNFWSTLAAPYPAPRQVLFCTGRDNAAGISLVEGLLARLEDDPREGVEAALLLPGEDESPPVNRKVWHLQRGLHAARHEWIVSGDSGTVLGGDELQALVATLIAEPGRGIAWAPSTSSGRGALGARLSHLAISTSTLSFHVIAALHRVLGRSFLSGALFAARREALHAIGEFEVFADQLAEDLEMGRRVEEAGWQVVVSPVPVVQNVASTTFREFYGRIHRWCVIMWQYREPLRVHYPMVMCSLALAPLTLIPAWLAYPEKIVEYLILGAALVLSRWAYAAILLVAINRRPFTLDLLWGEPLLEGVMLVAYVHALFVRRVRWRGRELRLRSGGRVERVGD